jgi:multiple sugar transport system permease protein
LAASNRKLIAYFLFPSLFILFAITIYPFIFGIYNSFHDWLVYRPQLGKPFVGFEQYTRIFSDPDFWMSLRLTVIYVIFSVSLSIILGFGQALVLSQDEIKGKGIIRSILLIPLVVAPIVVGFTFRFMYNAELGVLPWLLDQMGGNVPRILGDPKWALYAIILVDVWNQTPLAFLVLLAAMQGINPELYDVSSIDGASYWQQLQYITIPLLKRAFLIVLLIRTIDAFKAFDIIFVMTEGGPGRATEVLSLLGYRFAFVSWRMGTASAFALILFYMVVGVSLLYIRLIQKDETYAQ